MRMRVVLRLIITSGVGLAVWSFADGAVLVGLLVLGACALVALQGVYDGNLP